MELIILKSFLTPDEAYMMQSLLRSEGVESFLNNENVSQMRLGMSDTALGGVKLLVSDADLEVAYNILKERGYIKEEADQPKQNVKWLVLVLIVFVVLLLLSSRSCYAEI